MKIHRFGTAMHNWFIVAEGGRATVIDAGCSGEYDDLLAAMDSIGMELEDIETLLITHAHGDHFGFAKQADDNGIDVRIHEDDVPLATGTYDGPKLDLSALPLDNPRALEFVTVLGAKGFLNKPAMETIETFADGEVIDTPGRPRAIHTPGHTDGHAVFYFEEARAIFTGDALVTMAVFGGDDGPQVLPDLFHAYPTQAVESLQRMRGIHTDRIYPGHGNMLEADIDMVVSLMVMGG